MNNNISDISEFCYGCGVCVKACPKSCISLIENNSGFYSPSVNVSDCIKCGICKKVCSYYNKFCESNHKPTSFYGWSKDDNIRGWCSSGGIGFELARLYLEKGYKICAVKYDEKANRAIHYVATTESELMASVGSKYLPSYTTKGFTKINVNEKWIVIGTPCQIASFRRYLKLINKENNFLLIDFFCHGTPSLKLWDKYISELTTSKGCPTFVSWRNKSHGWHDSWAISADFNSFDICHGRRDLYQLKYDVTKQEPIHNYSSRWSKGDLFYDMFLGNFCLNDCCYKNCKFKGTSSAADIRLGDYWGSKFEEDNQGVSAIIAITALGERSLTSLQTTCVIQNTQTEDIMRGQLSHTLKKPWIRRILIKSFDSAYSLSWIYKNIIQRLYYTSLLPKRIVAKIKSYK